MGWAQVLMMRCAKKNREKVGEDWASPRPSLAHRTDSDDWALDHLSSLELRFQKRMTCEKSGIQVNIRSLRGQQSDREGANSLRQVKMSETGSHGSHRAPIQNRRKEAGINGSDFNSGGWIEAQSEGETSNNL
ncbi:hypothetical protein B9Z55_013887 [Caenorhabditis nigoni]|nr:hypothetical protein B9Z55_013887 [Caenorhabditis nigoni]